jgi:capsular polysaccharide biosynthesis protein
MEEIDLKEFVMLFWNRKVSIILITIIFMLIGIIYSVGFVTPKYTSSTTLLLATSESANSKTNTITTSDITLNSKLVSTYSELVKSKNVTRQVISNLGIDETEDELRDSITVSSVKDTELIKISVTDKNATNAYNIANEIAKVFTQKVSEIYNINNVQILDQAEISTIPSNINHAKDVIMFTFVGLFVAIVFVLVANMLDTTIKSSEEVEKLCNVPVIASIPLYSFEIAKNKGGKRRR